MRLTHKMGLVTLGLTLAGAALPATAHAAAASYPVSTFNDPYGASYVEGSVTWYNRSIDIQGAIKAVSNDMTAYFFANNANFSCDTDPTRTADAGTTVSFHFGETCDVPGGFTQVSVVLVNDSTGLSVGEFDMTRTSSVYYPS